MQAALALVSEPRRSEILRLVWRKELSAGDIARRLPVTFGAVSQHLALLREAGLVDVRREGRNRFYVARRDAFGPLADVLEAMWSVRLRRLRRVAEREEKKRARKR